MARFINRPGGLFSRAAWVLVLSTSLGLSGCVGSGSRAPARKPSRPAASVPSEPLYAADIPPSGGPVQNAPLGSAMPGSAIGNGSVKVALILPMTGAGQGAVAAQSMRNAAELALSEFQGVRRRMELRGVVAGVSVYDDFAHHPTAIETTIDGLRRRIGNARLVAVLEDAGVARR